MEWLVCEQTYISKYILIWVVCVQTYISKFMLVQNGLFVYTLAYLNTYYYGMTGLCTD